MDVFSVLKKVAQMGKGGGGGGGNLDNAQKKTFFLAAAALAAVFTRNNKTISDGGITVEFWIVKVHTSN